MVNSDTDLKPFVVTKQAGRATIKKINRKGGKTMYAISDATKSNIERIIGLDIDTIKNMTPNQEQSYIREKMCKKLTFSKEKKHSIAGRGNPLLARKKFRTLDDLNKKSKKYIGI